MHNTLPDHSSSCWAPKSWRPMLGSPLVLLLLVSVIASCSLVDSDPPESYALTRVDGNPVPTIVLTLSLGEGRTHTVEVLEGSITLYGGLKRFEKTRLIRVVHDGGEPSLDVYEQAGSFQRSDSQMTLRFVDNVLVGRDGVVTDTLRVDASHVYEILDGGMQLRGVEYVNGRSSRLYEYARVGSPSR